MAETIDEKVSPKCASLSRKSVYFNVTISFYNAQRPCYAIGYDTPDNYYRRFQRGEIPSKKTFKDQVLCETPKFVQKRKVKQVWTSVWTWFFLHLEHQFGEKKQFGKKERWIAQCKLWHTIELLWRVYFWKSNYQERTRCVYFWKRKTAIKIACVYFEKMKNKIKTFNV